MKKFICIVLTVVLALSCMSAFAAEPLFFSGRWNNRSREHYSILGQHPFYHPFYFWQRWNIFLLNQWCFRDNQDFCYLGTIRERLARRLYRGSAYQPHHIFRFILQV